jgi:hypothetical protein
MYSAIEAGSVLVAHGGSFSDRSLGVADHSDLLLQA